MTEENNRHKEAESRKAREISQLRKEARKQMNTIKSLQAQTAAKDQVRCSIARFIESNFGSYSFFFCAYRYLSAVRSKWQRCGKDSVACSVLKLLDVFRLKKVFKLLHDYVWKM